MSVRPPVRESGYDEAEHSVDLKRLITVQMSVSINAPSTYAARAQVEALLREMVVGDVLVATPLALGERGAPPGWTFDPEAGFWWHVVEAGEMWPLFDVLIFRPLTGMTDHDFI